MFFFSSHFSWSWVRESGCVVYARAIDQTNRHEESCIYDNNMFVYGELTQRAQDKTEPNQTNAHTKNVRMKEREKKKRMKNKKWARNEECLNYFLVTAITGQSEGEKTCVLYQSAFVLAIVLNDVRA